MFWKRLISGIILVILAIACLGAGGTLLLCAVGALSLIGQFELYRALKIEKTSLGTVGYLGTILYELLLFRNKQEWIEVYLLAVLLVFLITYVVCYPRYVFSQTAMAFTGIIYVSIMLSCLYLVRCMEGGAYLVWIIFISAWGSDTCAYCVGKLIGKHKMPSTLSPNKTMEGCSGGIIGAAVLAFLYAWIFRDELAGYGYIPWKLLIIGAVGGFLSQIGDLTASAIKRNYEIKDYGKLIPGHGGVMDRFDSILFTAPSIYIFLIILHAL